MWKSCPSRTIQGLELGILPLPDAEIKHSAPLKNTPNCLALGPDKHLEST